MSDVDRALLETVVQACRQALEGLSDAPYSPFTGFPKGACGIASDIVGRVIWEALEYEGVYVCASGHADLRPEASHAWFEVGGFIIDLTYDQFPGTGLSGWIFEAAEHWYNKFDDFERRDGFCPPDGFFDYPSDGYEAAVKAVAATGIFIPAD